MSSISQSTISKIENNKKILTVEELQILLIFRNISC
ncbi:helix-turn-helix domain-containing protein [Clostridium thermobutyricum]